jgi:hypothetical protein
MKPRSTEFYSDAYAYAVGYRDGREGNNVAFPVMEIFINHHKTLYRDGYEQGKRDYERYDHHNETPAYAPIQSGVTA